MEGIKFVSEMIEVKSMVDFKFSNGKIYFCYPYNSDFIAEVKTFRNRKWTGDCWQVIPDPSEVEKVKNFIKKWYNVEVKDEQILKLIEDAEKESKCIVVKDGVLGFRHPYDEDFLSAIRPLGKWNRLASVWEVDPRQVVTKKSEVLEVIQRFYGGNADLVELVERAWQEVESEIEKSRKANSEKKISLPGGDLFPFQVAGVEYLLEKKKVLLGDEMGLGKTIQAIAAVHQAQSYPVLVVCPKVVLLNWAREIKKWTGEDCVILNNGNEVRLDARWYAVNYDILKKHVNTINSISFRTIIIDESHYIKNPKAVRTQLVKSIVELQKPEFVLLLTGTAILNRPIELVTQLEILGLLGEFGGFWKFVDRYCNPVRGAYGWDFSGSANLTELNQKMRVYGYLRREKQDVLKELPEKTRAVVPVRLNGEMREYYAAEDDLAKLLLLNYEKRREIEEKIGKGEKLTDEEKFSLHELRRARNAEMLVKIEKLKQLVMKMKFDSIVEIIENILEQGEKVVVFAHHKEMIDYLATKFECGRIITGETNGEDRQKYVDEFQNNPDAKMIICNIKAGGVGITLNAAHIAVFAELGWTPSEHTQAEDRLHRIGQAQNVTVYYPIVLGTIEEHIYNLIFEKKKVVVDTVLTGEVAEEDVRVMDLLEQILISKHAGGSQ